MLAVPLGPALVLPLVLPLILAMPGLLSAQAFPRVRALKASHEEAPANVSGSEFTYDYKTDTIVVRGDALLSQGGSMLRADELDYTRDRREARAYGHVRLTDPEVELTASHVELDLDNETGRLFDARILATDSTYHLEGKEIDKLGGQRYSVKEGFFTTCGCEGGAPSWSIGADQMDVHLGATGLATGARFNILGYPILKLPYAVFPADTERSSGLLTPRIGESALRGFQYFQPAYFVINKSSDATLALDVETQARIGFVGEYRLVNGEDDYFRLNGAFMDETIRANRGNDVIDTQVANPHVPLDRYELIGITRQHLTPDLSLFGDTVSVSDSLYLREMNVYTLSRGYGADFAMLRDARSHFGLNQSFEDGFVRLMGTWHQDLIQDQQFALQTLPELLFSGRRDLGNGFAYSDYDVQAVNFWRDDGITGMRFDLNPRLTVPLRLGDYLTGYGTAGARETVYDASGHNLNVIPVGTAGLRNNNGLSLDGLNQGGLRTRELLYAGAGASSEIEKVYEPGWGSIEKVKHTIEPLVSYSFVPNVAQSRLPLFDEVDRVNPRSLVTYGLVSRLFIKTAPASEANEGTNRPGDDQDADDSSVSTLEGASYRSGSAGYVREAARLTMLQSYDLAHQIADTGSHQSDLTMDANLFPTSLASLGSRLGYNPPGQRITYANVYLNLRPPWASSAGPPLYMGRAVTGSFVQVMYNFVGDSQASHTFAARAYYELFDRFALYYAPDYDIAGGKMLSQEYGLRIKSKCNCWAFDFGVTDTVNPNELQVQFQVTLGGVGSIGQNPFGNNPFRNFRGGATAPLLY